MTNHAWIDEFPASVTVCDSTGTILEMNQTAIESFKKDGGDTLIGKNVLDCHPEPARTKLKTLLETHQKNVYFVKKHGVKIMVYQTPWYLNGEPQGIIELSFEIPQDTPTFDRDKE